MRGQRLAGLLLGIALICSACTGGGPKKPNGSSSPATARFGGTLRVGMIQWNGSSYADPTPMDDPPGLDACCLLRSLMSYVGAPTAEGGAEVRPDLASGPPEVSADGLTWTFHLKRGLYYAPPLEHTQIVAGDVIRAVERSLSPTPKPYADFFGTMLGFGSQVLLVVEGAQAYASGQATTISGLEAPDPLTLRVHLSRQAGDMPQYFALTDSAPIPPNPFRPGATFGVADGHSMDGYGRFLVSSGPYMIEGSGKVDFSKPPDQQQPASGLDPLVLVRNPSWRRSTDDLRPAYPDRIEFKVYSAAPYTPAQTGFGADQAFVRRARLALAAEVDDGTIDVVLDGQAPYEQVQRYLADPGLRRRLIVNEFGDVRFLSLDLAQPPFDDVHVRRAINYVIDRRQILGLWKEGQNSAALYTHLAPDATEDNLLINFDPYPSPDDQGDLTAAMREMRLSPYDRNGDGKCDAAACRNILVHWRQEAAYPKLAPVVKEDLAKIGIDVNLKIGPGSDMYHWCYDPSMHAALCQVGWSADFPSASTFFGPTVGDGALAFSVLSAAPSQLRKWGYGVASVPNVDSRITECETSSGSGAPRCWAAFDQYLMTDVIPAVPLITDTAPWTFSARVRSFSWSQATGAPALDRIAVAG